MDELDTPKPKGVVDVTEDDKSDVLRALEGDGLRDRVEDVEIRNVPPFISIHSHATIVS
uniref:Uncharacterized protein n=1 Tax=Cucumis melo TaxID=3656 RepID=A0A9I9CR89_CUCME